jgi:transcriptional regulator with XRE-family HTH domain
MDQPQQIAVRLRRLREALGFDSARDFAAFLDIPEQTWYHLEKGRRSILPPDAVKVCARTGVSMDWIYRGMEDTLPLHVFKKIQAVPEDHEVSQDRRRKSA